MSSGQWSPNWFWYTVAQGNTIDRPPNPVKNAYTFVDWFHDSTLGIVYDFATPIAGDITLYAQWITSNAVRDIASILQYLTAQAGGNSEDNPISLILQIDLGVMAQADGGGAAAYIRFDTSEIVILGITIGAGGLGASATSGAGNDLGKFGNSGNETRVSWGTNILTVFGGGGGTGNYGKAGGAGGAASDRPPIILNDPEYWSTVAGSMGGSGSNDSLAASQGGNAGSLNAGSSGFFGGGVGGYISGNTNSYSYIAPGIGAGGAGGWTSYGRGRDGGNGQVRVVITYFDR